MIQTIKEYANSKGIATQSLYQSKNIKIVELPIFVKHEGTEIEVGKKKFVIT